MRKNYSRDDIIKLVEEEDVEFIRLQFTDIFGNLKNLAITAGQLEICICTRILARWKFFRGDPSRERWRV